MHLRCEAIILSVRVHGEHGAIVRALTRDDGVRAGYVRGGRSRQFRPILQPANLVLAEWRARTDEQLASLSVEPLASRANLHRQPLAAAALEWSTALTAAALPEAQPYPRLHDALGGVLGAIEAAPTARGWAAALVRYELLLLAELGFGLALDACAATGETHDLAWVSPRTGVAVGRVAGAPHGDRLLPLPAFLSTGGEADWPAIFDGCRITGHFLARDILVDRLAPTLAARDRLIERLKRAVA